VGFDLDQKISASILGSIRCLLFRRTRTLRVFLTTGMRPYSVTCVMLILVKNYVVSTITTVFTAFSSFGLAAVSAWFFSERWIFSRHKGEKWLQDSLDDAWDSVTSIPPIPWVSQHMAGIVSTGFGFIGHLSMGARRAALQASSTLTNLFSRHPAEGLPISSSETTLPSAALPDATLSSLHTRRGSDVTHATMIGVSCPEPKSPGLASVIEFSDSEKPGSPSVPVPSSTGRTRLKNAVRSIMMMNSMSRMTSPIRPQMVSSSLNSPDGTRRDSLPVPMRSSRVAWLVPKLRHLTATQDLAAHQALVRHLQFSPNGKFLATSRYVFLGLGPSSMIVT